MGVKAELGGDKKEEINYPCLMKSKERGGIVLFKAAREGTCLYVGKMEETYVGEYSERWVMECFEPFSETLSLSNMKPF